MAASRAPRRPDDRAAGIVLKALVTGMIEHRRQHEMLEEPLAAE